MSADRKSDADCIFCKIIAGEIPCHRLLEDEHVLAFLDVGELDHERRFPVRTVGDQGIVSLEFLVDALGFEDALNTQHFLYLVLHGEPVLEVKRRQLAVRAPQREAGDPDAGSRPGEAVEAGLPVVLAPPPFRGHPPPLAPPGDAAVGPGRH